MPDRPPFMLQRRPHCPRYLDSGGNLRLGRPRVPGVPSIPPRRIGRSVHARVRCGRIEFLDWVERLLPREHPSGFEDIRGACCGK